MNSLLLLRHAKSSWDDPALDDFDRPLAPRGRRAASAMAAEMARRGWQPDRVLLSTALRARRTWALAAPLLPGRPELIFLERLYHAAPETILDLVRGHGGSARRLLVVGHNPGLEDMAARLLAPGSGGGPARDMAEKFPTCALARFETGAAWHELAFGIARLTHFLRPRDLRAFP